MKTFVRLYDWRSYLKEYTMVELFNAVINLRLLFVLFPKRFHISNRKGILKKQHRVKVTKYPPLIFTSYKNSESERQHKLTFVRSSIAQVESNGPCGTVFIEE